MTQSCSVPVPENHEEREAETNEARGARRSLIEGQNLSRWAALPTAPSPRGGQDHPMPTDLIFLIVPAALSLGLGGLV